MACNHTSTFEKDILRLLQGFHLLVHLIENKTDEGKFGGGSPAGLVQMAEKLAQGLIG